MRVYVDVYDNDGEWRGTFEYPLDSDELREKYGEFYRLKNWKCEHDDVNPILENIALNFTNRLLNFVDELLKLDLEDCPKLLDN